MTALIDLAALALTAFLCAATSVLCAADGASALLTRARAHRMAEGGREGAVALERLLERPGRTTAAAAVFTAVTSAFASLTCVILVSDIFPAVPSPATFGIGLALGTFVVFSFAVTLPRTIAVQNPEDVGLAAAGWALRLADAAHPLVRLLGVAWTRGARLVRGEESVDDPWATSDIVRAGGAPDEDAARDQADDDLIDAVAAFAETRVREVMVPRTDMRCLEDDATVEDALALISETGYSRLPVFHDTLDDIRGVLYAKDLLLEVGRGELRRGVAAVAREARFVPETKSVEELLVDMRSTKTHIAIVADEYGGTAGLVTIEDLIEEIVGDIFDEYDRDQPLVVELADGRLRVDARLPVDELNERFGTAIESDADTVGGLVSELAGRIPALGDGVEVEGLRITVDDLQGTRIRQLVVEPASRLAGAEGAEDA
ncbi:MAG: hemolysin family protein [Coriobacteriia bacterium]